LSVTAGGTTPVPFGNWTPSVAGVTYTLTMTVSMSGEGDVCNNVITSSVLVIPDEPIVTVDLESNNGGFSVASGGVWEYGVPTDPGGPLGAHTGTKVWGTVLAGNYPDSACASLVTSAFAVPATGGALVFYTWYDNEFTWDGCTIKVSVDGGPFVPITPAGGYPAIEGGNLCPLVANLGFLTGTTGGWIPLALDLGAYNGHSVIVAFDFGSDSNTDYSGTYLDDFTLYNFFVQHGCPYKVGDINNDGNSNGIDVVFGVNYFKGGLIPPVVCDCPDPNPIYGAGDVNGNCVFNGIDITYYVAFLKGNQPSLLWCPTCPPSVLPSPALTTPGLKANAIRNGNTQ
jgi:hypothetical protein